MTKSPTDTEILSAKLDGLIALVARLVPPETPAFDPNTAEAFIWRAEESFLQPVDQINRIDLDLLVGVDLVRDKLLDNTRQFARGFAANNVLMWGARGMGKSSLVKATQRTINQENAREGLSARLKLIEIHREDIDSLPALMRLLRGLDHRFIVFCDDLSFDGDDASYKSLKSALDGGVEGRPDNVIFYATSNRRHLIPRDMMENERSTAINPSETTEEKVSLSDRFGLWLGFHKCTQEDYLAMIEGYAARYDLDIATERLRFEALEWAKTRGNRSGRVAWQYIQDLAGRLGKVITLD
ncbi:MAG: ATP-binding protein [Rhizobiales bacterium]|nr:ATP-binding protein [Hyphomicrobiales bacterium]